MKQAFDPREHVSRETRDKLDLYADLLLHWSSRINLVSRSDLAQLWPRHIADSLQLLPHLEGAPHAIDLGSGAGFPGLVLCIASAIPFDLVESDTRKAAFLREAARVTQAPATVHAARIETIRLAPAPIITARALAPLDKLIGLARPLLQSGGRCLFLKGKQVETELTLAYQQWNMQVDRVPSQTQAESWLLKIQAIEARH